MRMIVAGFKDQGRGRRRSMRRGTVLVMAIILSITLTGMVIGIAWSQGLMSSGTSAGVQTDEAYYVAESGAERLLWYWKHNSYAWTGSGSWTASVRDASTGRAAESWTQAYSCVADAKTPGAYDISCTAKNAASGSSFWCSFVATPPSPSQALLAGGNNGNISGKVTINGDYATNGTLQNGNNLTINGNAIIGGAITCAPTVTGNLSVKGDDNGAVKVGGNMIVTGNVVASANVAGNLTVNGTIQNNPKVGGIEKSGASSTVTVPAPPSVSSIVTALSAKASGAGKINGGTINTLNFATAPNGIILINGDATISQTCTVVGNGTVVVTGNWIQGHTFPPTGTASCNIVVARDMNITGVLNLNGSVYGGNNWNQSAAFNITGSIITTGDSNVNLNGAAKGVITAGPIPSFDPRSSGGASSIVLSSFSGPGG